MSKLVKPDMKDYNFQFGEEEYIIDCNNYYAALEAQNEALLKTIDYIQGNLTDQCIGCSLNNTAIKNIKSWS